MANYNLDEIQQKLLERKKIDLLGEVNSDMAVYVRKALVHLIVNDCPDITLSITSPGGSADIGLHIYDMLHNYPAKITGIAMATAYSMAVVILQACAKRWAYANTKFLAHDLEFNKIKQSDLKNKKKLSELQENINEQQEQIYKILSKRTGQSLSTIRKECAKNQEMSAKKALQFGLIDKII